MRFYNFLYNRIPFKVNAVAYDFLTNTILSVLRETKNKAWKWANENAKFFQTEPENLIKKIIQAKFPPKTDTDFLINLTKTKLIEVFFAAVSEIDFKGDAHSLLPTDDFVFIVSLDKITRCFSYGDSSVELST